MTTRKATAFGLAVSIFLWMLAVSPAIAWQEKVEASLLTKALPGGKVEVLIYLAEQADLSASALLATKEEKGAYVYGELTATAAATQPAVLADLALSGVEHRAFWIVNVIWARGDLAFVQAMAQRPDVAFVYDSGAGFLDLPGGVESVSATALPAEWNIELVRANEVWELGITGQGAVVAGADTGVEWTHPALKNQYRGWDGANADHNYNWHLGANPNVVCPQFPSTEPCDDDALLAGGHGTHTVGTIVGDDGQGNRIGMAPGARWIACRNMNFGVGTVPSYLDCMQWFLAPTDLAGANPDPSKAPHVVNNSWGCVEGCPPPILKAQIESSRDAGIFYAVSAGNDGSRCSSLAFPLAIYEAAFSVGATNINDQIAGFSSRGPILTDVPNLPRVGPDISAPGVNVRSALKGGGYGSLSGTSMAGPHVAGLAALIISANPSLAGDVDRIEQIIMSTALHLTTSQACGDDTPESVPNNSYGWGRIDALAAVLEAIASTSAGKVTGGGWIPDGGGGHANFGFTAHGGAMPHTGRLTYHDKNEGIKVKGSVGAVSLLSATKAGVSGTCELEGAACRFTLTVEDNGESGAGVDRLAITVTDLSGNVLHEADEALGGGNIKIH